MGFSVSATYLLLFFALLFAMGMLNASAANAVEEVREAQQFQNERISTVQGTALNVTDVAVDNATRCAVTVNASNVGDTLLERSATDVFVDGRYVENVGDRSTVDGGDSQLWRPDGTLSVDVGDLAAPPERVAVVAGPGVADATEVSGLSC